MVEHGERVEVLAPRRKFFILVVCEHEEHEGYEEEGREGTALSARHLVVSDGTSLDVTRLRGIGRWRCVWHCTE